MTITKKGMFAALLCASALAAQDAATAAETAYRTAWWQESGKGDLEAALRGYLAAVAATGPENVRAQALLAAGAAQQRLGRSEAAIATFRQLLRDFPTQKDCVERAQGHLAELLAVDLRDGYDEWYDRRLFSEAMQQQLLDLLHEIAHLDAVLPGQSPGTIETLRAQLHENRRKVLAYGKAAIPALKREAQSADDNLADASISLLFALGELPPTAVLLQRPQWADDCEAWRVVLRRQGVGQVVPEAARTSLRGQLLLAALRGPAALAQVLVTVDIPAGVDDLGPIRAVARALLEHDAAARSAIVEAIVSTDVPVRIRMAIEDAVVEAYEVLLPSDDLLRMAAHAQRFELGVRAVRGMAQQVRRGEEQKLELVLQMVERSPDKGRGDAAMALCEGMRQNVAAVEMQWTPAMLAHLLAVAREGNPSDLDSLLTDIRRSDRGLEVVAEAALGEDGASTLLAWERKDGAEATEEADAMLGRLREAFAIQTNDERDTSLLASRWHRAVVAFLDGQWAKWGDPQRLNALRMLGIVVADDERAPLRAFLTRIAADASADVRQRIEELSQSWD